MVSRTPQLGDVGVEGRHSATTHASSMAVVKETQRESNGPGTPRHVKKDGQASTKAQDVAELKDYVGNYGYIRHDTGLRG